MLLAFLLSSVSLRYLCVESGLKLRLMASVHHVSINIINTKFVFELIQKKTSSCKLQFKNV